MSIYSLLIGFEILWTKSGSRKYKRKARALREGPITYPHDKAMLWAVKGLFTGDELEKQDTVSIYVCFLVYYPMHEELRRKVTDRWTHKRDR